MSGGSSIPKREETLFVGLQLLSWDLKWQKSRIVPKPDNVPYHEPQPRRVQSQPRVVFTHPDVTKQKGCFDV